MKRNTLDLNMELNRIRGIANYQFGKAVGRRFFPNNVKIALSKRTGRIRHIHLDSQLLATLRPTDGLLSLTIHGARRLSSLIEPPALRVIVQRDVAAIIRKGGNVFARHILTADINIRSGEEVLVADEEGKIIAVGRALLTGKEMLSFKRGIGVKVRSGSGECGR